jgi:transcriptional regulator with PAS, ATPase and Fis domain
MQTTEKKPAASTAAGMEATLGAWLVFAAGEIVSDVRWVPLEAPSISIGRDAPGGIAVPSDIRMSRRHATIHTNAFARLSVTDEASRNGTIVNGKRVTERALQRGDVISCGDSCLVIAEIPAGVPDAVVPDLRGEAASMRRLRTAITLFAPTPGTVLIQADSGCGKELVARALHEKSGVRGDFVAINCAAVPEELAESLLFGHISGAFTGASAQQGLFRAASGGTLFLDEIAELSEAVQAKLLRALEDRSVLPVGATKPVPCAVRIIAATHRVLSAEVARGTFRGDLYARLRELHLAIPPLRERREDLLRIFVSSFGARSPRMTHALAEALLVYDWPYNVRELLAVARELGIVAAGGEPLDARQFLERTANPPTPPVPRARMSTGDDAPIDRTELERLLREHHGVVAKVAEAVGRSRRQVYRWLAHHNIDLDGFREQS